MVYQRRIYRFSGGFLETNDYGDESESSKVHPEQFTPSDDQLQAADMHCTPTCLGYLRIDVSGTAHFWHQSQIRRLAERLGYGFADMVIYDPKFGRPPLARLEAQATRLDAEAVIVPGPEHFENGQIPSSLVEQLDVITVTPEETYARLARPDLPAQADGV